MSKPTDGKPRIMVAIPAYNEGTFIDGIVSGARRHSHTVVVIDDGSTDDTSREASASGATVVRNETNRGYGEAIRRGFEVAKAEGVDVLVTLDGDGQHNPMEIPELLRPILEGKADLVIGSRLLQPQEETGRTRMPTYRRFGIRVITGLFNVGSKTRISDAQSGFRAYGKRVLDSITLTETGMAVSVEAIIKARAKGFVIQELPISCKYHSTSSTFNPVGHGLAVAFAVIRLRLRHGRML